MTGYAASVSHARSLLCAALRDLRIAARMTQEDVAAALGWSESRVSRTETVATRHKQAAVTQLLDLYGADTDSRSRVLRLLKETTVYSWWDTYQGILPDAHLEYLARESRASMLRLLEPRAVPALLQTAPYASALLAGSYPEMPDAQRAQIVDARMDRQQRVLAGPEPPRIWAVLDEAVLHRVVGGGQVMTEQLAALHKAAQLDHVTVQVVPYSAGAYPGQSAPAFTVLDFSDDLESEVVYGTSPAGEALLEAHAADAAGYAKTWEQAVAMALSAAKSLALIDHISEAPSSA